MPHFKISDINNYLGFPPIYGFMKTLQFLLSLTKPRIFLAIGLTAWLGFFLKEDFFSHRFLDSVLLFLATVLASASGAVFNHFFERKTDAKMDRTKKRPLVDAGPGAIKLALAFGTGIGILGHAICWHFFGPVSAFWLFMGWVNYVVIYTLIFKHHSQWNVTIGSFASSFSVLCGDAAFTGELTTRGLILATILFFWNPAHFWNLTALYQKDYAQADIPMLTAWIGRKKVVIMIMSHILIVIACSYALWFYGNLGLTFLVGSMITGCGLLGLNLQNYFVLSDGLFKRNFILSNIYLLALYITVVLDRLYPI